MLRYLKSELPGAPVDHTDEKRVYVLPVSLLLPFSDMLRASSLEYVLDFQCYFIISIIFGQKIVPNAEGAE